MQKAYMGKVIGILGVIKEKNVVIQTRGYEKPYGSLVSHNLAIKLDGQLNECEKKSGKYWVLKD